MSTLQGCFGNQVRYVKCSAWFLSLSKHSASSVTTLTGTSLCSHLISFMPWPPSVGCRLHCGSESRQQASLYLLMFLSRVSQLGKDQDNAGTLQGGSVEANIPLGGSAGSRNPSVRCRLWWSPNCLPLYGGCLSSITTQQVTSSWRCTTGSWLT